METTVKFWSARDFQIAVGDLESFNENGESDFVKFESDSKNQLITFYERSRVWVLDVFGLKVLYPNCITIYSNFN